MNLNGILYALLSASFYGTGEFIGGYSSRKITSSQTVVISSFSAIFCLIILGIFFKEPFPNSSDILFAILSGISGGIGLNYYFSGIANGNSAVCTSISGITGACIPAVFSIIRDGFPDIKIIIGMILGLIGIYLVTRKRSTIPLTWKTDYKPGFLSGAGFGFFFLFLGLIKSKQIFYLLMISKIASAITGFSFSYRSSSKLFINPFKNVSALTTGIFDTIANGFYMSAKQLIRLDISAVLVSTYPLYTIVLSKLIFKENIRKRQWTGVILCIAGIGLISS